METVIYDQSPLADYLRDEGDREPIEWAASDASSTAAGDAHLLPDSDVDVDSDDAAAISSALPATPAHQTHQTHQTRQRSQRSQRNASNNPSQNGVDTPPPSPPSPSYPSYAPVGRPMVRKRFRNKIPNPLHVGHQRRSLSLSSINNRYSRAVVSTMNRADNAQFLEKFRYTIITSHLLGAATLSQQQLQSPRPDLGRTGETPPNTPSSQSSLDAPVPTATGVVAAVTGAFVLAWAVHWVYIGGIAHLTKKRFFLGIVVLAGAVFIGNAYVRQQWLHYVRQSALAEVKAFVARSHDFDSAAGASIAFIKEVELVSRGYRISAPLPPISRMDDRSQSRRCMRIRKAVRSAYADALPKYIQAANAVKGFAEPLDLEMYYHVHDITDFDVSDAMQGFTEAEFDDADAIRTLSILAARLHTLRKIFLCALLALEASGDDGDFLRWTTAVEGLRSLNETTQVGFGRLHNLLGEAETFPQTATPKAPLSPNRERWRSQLGKLNSLSTGIRGLQAKLALLREESDRSLNEASDITELGPNLLAQYESIGQDLKLLIAAWEEGKSALASGIDRNEKRLSSIGALLSPAVSLSGLTTVGEDGGTAEDALRALTGGSPLGGSTVGDPDEEQVYEAVSLPSQSKRRSLLPREERIAKMKEERDRRAEAREQADANRGMLRELEMVINLRPKGKQADAAAAHAAGATTPRSTTSLAADTNRNSL